MKKLIFSVILALAALVGAFRIQSEQKLPVQKEQYAPAVKTKLKRCFSLASYKFMQGKSEAYRLYADYFNEICISYNAYKKLSKQIKENIGNEKLEFLLWRALIEKQDRALEIVLDMIQHARNALGIDIPHDPAVVNETAECLKEVGEERCLLGLMGQTIVGGAATVPAAVLKWYEHDRGIGNKEERDAIAKSLKTYSDLKSKRGAVVEQIRKLSDTELPIEASDEEHQAIVDQIIKIQDDNIDLPQQIHNARVDLKEQLSPTSDELQSKSLGILASERLAYLDEVELFQIGAGIVAVAGGVVAMDAFRHVYQTRQERKRWEKFKKDKNYQTVLADSLNKFIDVDLTQLDQANTLIARLYDQPFFKANRLLQASLRWVIEYLNKGRAGSSVQDIRRQFTWLLSDLKKGKITTAQDLKDLGIEPSSWWGSGRWKEDYSFDVYMKPPSQLEVLKFLRSKSPEFFRGWWTWEKR